MNFLRPQDIDDAVRCLMSRMKKVCFPNKWKTVYYLMYYSGVSRDEAVHLKKENFDLDRCSLNIEWTDHFCPRTTFYPKKVMEMIKNEFRRGRKVKNAFNISEERIDYRTYLLRPFLFNNRRFTPYGLRTAFGQLLRDERLKRPIRRQLRGLENKGIPIEVIESEYKMRISRFHD